MRRAHQDVFGCMIHGYIEEEAKETPKQESGDHPTIDLHVHEEETDFSDSDSSCSESCEVCIPIRKRPYLALTTPSTAEQDNILFQVPVTPPGIKRVITRVTVTSWYEQSTPGRLRLKRRMVETSYPEKLELRPMEVLCVSLFVQNTQETQIWCNLGGPKKYK